jgi:hypothetical protein
MLALLSALALASSNESVVLDVVGPTSREEVPQCRVMGQRMVNGSRSQLDALGRGLWVIDDENDEVLLVELETSSSAPVTKPGTTLRFPTGAWPEQLVVGPTGRVFVSARQAGQVVVIEPDLQTTWSIPLASEPRALALDVTLQRLYVGLITAREVVALDANTGAVLQRRKVTDAPDFLALSDSGLLVASRRSDVVQVFGPSLEVRQSLEVEVTQDIQPVGLLSLGNGGSFGVGDSSGLLGRTFVDPGTVRGVIGLAAQGPLVSVAVERATTTGSPFAGLFGTRGGGGGGGGYGGGTTVPIRHELFVAHAEVGGLSVERELPLGEEPLVELTMSGGKTWVVAETTRRLESFGAGPSRSVDTFTESWGGLLQGITAMEDGSVLITTRGRVVRWIDAGSEDRTNLQAQRRLTRRPMNTIISAALPPSRLDAQLRHGRELFHLGQTQFGGGALACVACHPDGREDGRTWTQLGSFRQTPLLADRLVGTAPYNWVGSSPTLEANIQQTVTERLNGRPLAASELHALSRFLLEGIRPVTKRAAPAPDLVARGAELFADEEVGCAHCHPAQQNFTDGKRHDVKFVTDAEKNSFAMTASTGFRRGTLFRVPTSTGSIRDLFASDAIRPEVPAKTAVPEAPRVPRKLDTPSLKHLAVSAPYLHDGQARTLMALLETNHDRMGETSQLSRDEREALVAYLESL